MQKTRARIDTGCFTPRWTTALAALAGMASASLAEDIYWVGYQNGCMVVYPQNASFFHGDNWWNFVVPGPGDTVLMGTGFDPGGGGIPRTIHFGDFCVDVFACPNPIFLPAGTAQTARLVIQDGDYVFDFGPGETGITSCTTRPVDRGGYEILGRDVAPLVLGDIVQTTGLPGNASLTLQGGGTLSAHYGYLGRRAGTSGELVVRDDAELDLSWFLDVGTFGPGDLHVRGGSVYAPILIIGRDTSGEVTINSGGTVELASEDYLARAVLGLEQGSTGSIVVAGPGSAMTIEGQSTVGVDGRGTVVVRDGARVAVAAEDAQGPHGSYGLSILGQEADGIGTVRLSHDASWAQTGQLIAGRRGEAMVSMTSGASLEIKDWPGTSEFPSGLVLGEDVGSAGRLELGGIGSQLDIEGRIWIGSGGEGSMSILSGAELALRGTGRVSGLAILGFAPDGIGRLDVSDTDTRVVVEGQLTIGREGSGHTEVVAGATVRLLQDPAWPDSALTVLGAMTGSDGTLVISGRNTAFLGEAQIQVGNAGSGLLEIRDGATMRTMKSGSPTGSSGIVSASGAGPGLAILDGVDTAWTQDGAMVVGFGGRGELRVTNGASIHSDEARLAYTASSHGVATIDGAGSSWVIDSAMHVGYSGPAELRVSGGGLLHSGEGIVSLLGASVATVEVIGEGSAWHVDSNLAIGGNQTRASSGSGTLRILDAATVQVGGNARLWHNATVDIVLPHGGGVVPLSVDGSANLAGRLSIAFADGYIPTIGDRHRVVAAGDIVAAFETVELPVVPPGMAARVLYEPGAVVLALLCRADIDGDGLLTIFDFLAFQNLFAAGDLRADFDGDGELTIFDFLEFQNEFAAGCP